LHEYLFLLNFQLLNQYLVPWSQYSIAFILMP
jgi:hypothetical protein